MQAVSGESWEASEQGSGLVRHRLEEVRLASKSAANVPLPPGTCRLPSGLVHSQQRPSPHGLPLPSFLPILHTSQQSPPFYLQEVDLLQAGPRVRSPTWHAPRLGPGLSPDLHTVPYSGSTALCCQGCKHLPPRGSPWVTACKRKGPDCRGTPSGTPDTAWGSLALLSRTSGTPSNAGIPLNE